jgi:hypothetical protein
MNFTFDWNEWFIILSSIICLLLFIMLPKRFNALYTFLLWLLVIIFIETIKQPALGEGQKNKKI